MGWAVITIALLESQSKYRIVDLIEERRMERIKVLQFTIAASMGGRTTYILNQWRHINKDKIQFDFVTFSKDLSCEKELLQQGCIVHHIEHHPTEDKQHFIEEFEKVLEYGYDVIEIHTSFWEDTIVEEMAKKSGIKKIIIHAHTTGCTKKRASMEVHCKVRESLTDDIATDFWACSREAGEWIFGDSIAKDKVKILPNTIETERFQFCPEKRMELRRRYNLENKFVIGQIGRLEFVKNHEFTLKLLRKLVQIVPNIELLILGSGDEKERLEKLVYEFGIEAHVAFLGRKDDVEDWLQVMDVFLLPSFSEAFPIALIEAETAGLKCVCSDRITQDAVLTDDVVYLSIDDEELWVNEILKYKDGYERKNGRDAVAKAGYEVLDAIHLLENEYMNFIGEDR